MTFFLVLGLLAASLRPTPSVAGQQRKLFVEFTGICTFVPRPPNGAGKRDWTVLLPYVKGITAVNSGATSHVMQHVPYVKFWKEPANWKASPCKPVTSNDPAKAFVICDLDREQLTFKGPLNSSNVLVKNSFEDNVVSLDSVTAEGKVRAGDLDDAPFPAFLSARLNIGTGTLHGDTNPLARWNFNPAYGTAAARPLARGVVWEVDLGPQDSANPLILQSSRGWSITLDSPTTGSSFVVTIAQTPEDEKKIANFYATEAPEADDTHFLLHYSVLEAWNAAGPNAASVLCTTTSPAQPCPHPILDVSAAALKAAAGHARKVNPFKGKKTDCHPLRVPEQ